MAQAMAIGAALRDCARTGEAQYVAADERPRDLRGPGGAPIRIDAAGPERGNGSRLFVLSFSAGAYNHRITRRRTSLLESFGALSSGMFYVIDICSERISYIDPKLAAILGASPERPISLDEILECIHPHDIPRMHRHVAMLSTLSDEEIAETTLRVRTGRQWRWLRIRARAFSRGKDGLVRRSLGVAVDVTATEELSRNLADVSAALACAEDAERRRIGRELHDSTSQHLVAIDLSLTAMERLRLPSDASELIGHMREAIATAYREIRTFSYMLHPPSLRENGLSATLNSFCDGFGKRANLDIRLSLDDELQRFSYETELALFRCAQEALMNVHQHSGAACVWVRLRREAEFVALQVEDDGVGLSKQKMAGEATGRGVGINGMHARMVRLGGSLTLDSDRGGLRLTARAPYHVMEDRPLPAMPAGAKDWPSRSRVNT